METPNVGGLSLLPGHLLERIAEILEVTDPDSVTKLGERVESAMREYKASTEPAPPSPRELSQTFENISGRYRDLYESLTQLGPAERSIVDDASLELHLARLQRDERFGMDEAITALRKVGILIRAAQSRLPKVKHGPQRDDARWSLVHRLGVIYSQTRPSKPDDPREEFERPTRRYNAHLGKDYGPFRDFVVAVHTALGFDDPERGVDDLIRSVWGGMGKKRRQRQ